MHHKYMTYIIRYSYCIHNNHIYPIGLYPTNTDTAAELKDHAASTDNSRIDMRIRRTG